MNESQVSEKTDGPTPGGGAYAIAYYRERNGSPVAKDRAVRAEIVEFDSHDQPIHRTYSDL